MKQNQVLSKSLASLCLQAEKNSSLWLMVASSGLCMIVSFSVRHNLQELVVGLKEGR